MLDPKTSQTLTLANVDVLVEETEVLPAEADLSLSDAPASASSSPPLPPPHPQWVSAGGDRASAHRAAGWTSRDAAAATLRLPGWILEDPSEQNLLHSSQSEIRTRIFHNLHSRSTLGFQIYLSTEPEDGDTWRHLEDLNQFRFHKGTSEDLLLQRVNTVSEAWWLP